MPRVPPRERRGSPSHGSGGASALVAGRYRLLERLGVGGMGEVYRAHDEQHDQDVALKFLSARDPDRLYLFKREFRAMADLVHPNLVTLYAMNADEQRWFIAMELVEGARDFLEHVCTPVCESAEVGWETPNSARSGVVLGRRTGVVPESRSGVVRDNSTPRMASEGAGTSGPARSVRAVGAPSVETLKSALQQLTEGLAHLHAAGVLHCDVKPSNVLVNRNGRVLLADFGVVQQSEVRLDRFFGTALYASPELLAGEPLTPASDWYGVGVMLYEALTGALPTRAQGEELLNLKRRCGWPSPRVLNPEVDGVLEGLCLALLDPDPARRPDAAAVRKVLGQDTSVGLSPSAQPEAAPFVGRHDERAQLARAFAQARSGRTCTVLVRGPSGAGKSALVRHMVEQWKTEGAFALWGRCHEAERIPFKALDGLVDELAASLRGAPAERVESWLPGDDELGALAHLFPTLRRVLAVKLGAASSSGLVPERVRELAARGLCRLLANVASQQPVVAVIDDLQWGDVDSAPMLRELVSASARPGLLLICTYRTDAGSEEPALAESLKPRDFAGEHAPLYQMPLSPLSEGDASELVRIIVGEAQSGQGVDEIVREGLGSPFFLCELAHARRVGEIADVRSGLSALLARRVAALDVEQRALLELVSLTTRPQPSVLLTRAARLQHEAQTLAQLRAARLIRVEHSTGGALLAPYHDQIRETVARSLSPAARAELHGRLAAQLSQADEPDVEALVVHYREAGERLLAGQAAHKAALRALRAQAHDIAEKYFAAVLELSPLGPDERLDVQTLRADALLAAGKLRDAASAYLDVVRELASTRPPDAGPLGARASTRSARLHSQAFLCLLRAGELERAAALSTESLRNLGVLLPRSKASTLFTIVRLNALLALRGLRPRELKPASPEVALELELLFDANSALAFTDPLRGYAVHLQTLRSALAHGEPSYLARALCDSCAYRAYMQPVRERETIDRLLDDAERLAREHSSEQVEGYVEAARGMVAFLGASDDFVRTGRRLWATVSKLDTLDASERHRHVIRDRDAFRVFAVDSLALGGQFAFLREQLPTLLHRARDRGNEYVHDALLVRFGMLLYLALDRPDEARRMLDSAQLGEAPVQLFHHAQLSGMTRLYQADFAGACEVMQEFYQNAQFGPATSGPSTRAGTAQVWVMSAVALSAGGAAPDRALSAKLKRELAVLSRCRKSYPLARGFFPFSQAALWLRDGRRDDAVSALREALQQFDALGAHLWGMPARLTLGELVGGPEGKALCARALELMAEQCIEQPERFARAFFPLDAILGRGVGSKVTC